MKQLDSPLAYHLLPFIILLKPFPLSKNLNCPQPPWTRHRSIFLLSWDLFVPLQHREHPGAKRNGSSCGHSLLRMSLSEAHPPVQERKENARTQGLLFLPCTRGQETASRPPVLSNNSVGLPFGVCQDNYTPTGNTEADDHLRDVARLRRDSQLHGPPGHQVDVGARPQQRRPRQQAAAPAVFERRVLRRGGRCGGFRRRVSGGGGGSSPGTLRTPRQ